MGMVYVNGRPVVAPGAQVRVSELKELAQVPSNERLYDRDGRVLADDEVVKAEGQYGAVTDWERG